VGNVPDFITVLADCRFEAEDDSSCVDESSHASRDCSRSEQSFHLEINVNKSIDEKNNALDNYFSNDKNKIMYDDDSYIFSNATATTTVATFSDDSVRNASIATEECFQGEVDQPQFNYCGPKVVPTRHETPVSILTANTIGTLRSRRIFRVLFGQTYL
jgi:hypothetical protein